MRLILPLIALCILFAGQSAARVITLAEAKKVAQTVAFERANSAYTGTFSVKEVTTIPSDGEALYYVVNLSENGFVIVAADDIVMPVLGYSFESAFDQSNLPVNFANWMQGYAQQIISARELNLQPDARINSSWDHYLHGTKSTASSRMTSVEPMLTCIWNQGAPYNFLCPADPAGPGGHVYAGCVATAMSQIAYYWRWPLQGNGSHGYYWENYGYLFADFGNTEYHWNEMTNSILGMNFEMAQLQSHMGIAVDMMYGPDGSGAYSEDAAYALKTYFGYSDDLTLVYKDNYSDVQWSELMMQQLDAGHPMYYHGFGTGGHAFNLDGYADSLYFHFNWGWGSTANGYFLLSNLNPAGNNFNSGQGAIINFYPDSNYPYYCAEMDSNTMCQGTLEDGSGPLAAYAENSSCNWLLAPADSISNLKLTFHRFDLEENHDFLTIYDGADTTAPVLATLTGQAIPPPVTAAGSKMLVRFTSDNSGTHNGWFASYSSGYINFCPGITTFTEPEGSFTDGSGTFNYHNSSNCKYRIAPPGAQSIILTFNEFNTFDDNDFINIVDLNTGTVLYRLSGSDNPGPLTLNTGKLLIIFITDEANTSAGWSISYQSSNYASAGDPTGSIRSVYPNPAGDMLNISYNSLQGEKTRFILYDAAGRLVYNKQVETRQHTKIEQIDVSSLMPGIYSLCIINSKGVAYHKVVIE